jgi:hypothetical protein
VWKRWCVFPAPLDIYFKTYMYNCKSWWALPYNYFRAEAEQVPLRASTTDSELRPSRCRPEQQ